MNQPGPSSSPQPRTWFRPGGIALMLVMAGLFVWGNLSYRGASARDSLCVDPSVVIGTEERFIYVQGLPLAYFAEHEWGGWPHREYMFWFPLLLNVAVCAAATVSVAVAWCVWSGRPGRKARFQYHLSTAVILMFVAGLVVWANCAPSSEGAAGGRLPIGVLRTKVWSSPDDLTYWYYGWPLPVWEVDREAPAYNEGSLSKTAGFEATGPFRTKEEAIANLVYDVLACLGIVLFVGLLCEAWIVWRAQRRKESAST